MPNQHAQAPHANTMILFDSTIEAFDGGPLKTSTQEGLSLINDWLRSLKTSEADNVAHTLEKLKTALDQPVLDNVHIRSILLGLAEQADQWSAKAGGDMPARLQSLAQSLRNFGNQLA